MIKCASRSAKYCRTTGAINRLEYAINRSAKYCRTTGAINRLEYAIIDLRSTAGQQVLLIDESMLLIDESMLLID
jgi:hypothetical protein